jgi:hypothetical protein
MVSKIYDCHNCAGVRPSDTLPSDRRCESEESDGVSFQVGARNFVRESGQKAASRAEQQAKQAASDVALNLAQHVARYGSLSRGVIQRVKRSDDHGQGVTVWMKLHDCPDLAGCEPRSNASTLGCPETMPSATPLITL